MRITDIAAMAFAGLGETAARLRRDAIAYALCGLCALAAVVMATSASIIALEPEVGAVYARLIVAGAFVLIALAILLAVRFAKARPDSAARASAAPLGARSQTRPQFAQIAMIVEAVMLGYSLSRRSDRR